MERVRADRALRVAFLAVGWTDYLFWQDEDHSILARLNVLIEECRRNPFKGLGKPEPLKGEYRGWWSRRITQSDRLIYRVVAKGEEQTLVILQCRFHYDRP